jgi:hypothetical protein
MHSAALLFLAVSLATRTSAAVPPLVERFLHSGDLANGQQALEAALAAAPDDDQVRFGLGVVQFVRGVERLGQSLHEYGLKPVNAPFLRLPVPENPDPAPIHDAAFRRLLDDFCRDLAAAEATLAGITDENVRLPLRLAEVRLDLDADGRPSDKLLDILQKISRQDYHFLKTNPEFLVCFDGGDVIWLRAYCHLLMGMADCYLAFDTEPGFELGTGSYFARPRKRTPEKDAELKHQSDAAEVVVKEPLRLGRARRHFVRVAELNHETWKLIRAEQDDDHEWLPSPKQKGVLGLPVRDSMIDGWLNIMSEFQAILEGKRLIPWYLTGRNQETRALNLKTFLDDPPQKFAADGTMFQDLPDKYFSEGEYLNLRVLFSILRVFNDTPNFGVGYAMWFN